MNVHKNTLQSLGLYHALVGEAPHQAPYLADYTHTASSTNDSYLGVTVPPHLSFVRGRRELGLLLLLLSRPFDDRDGLECLRAVDSGLRDCFLLCSLSFPILLSRRRHSWPRSFLP